MSDKSKTGKATSNMLKRVIVFKNLPFTNIEYARTFDISLSCANQDTAKLFDDGVIQKRERLTSAGRTYFVYSLAKSTAEIDFMRQERFAIEKQRRSETCKKAHEKQFDPPDYKPLPLAVIAAMNNPFSGAVL